MAGAYRIGFRVKNHKNRLNIHNIVQYRPVVEHSFGYMNILVGNNVVVKRERRFGPGSPPFRLEFGSNRVYFRYCWMITQPDPVSPHHNVLKSGYQVSRRIEMRRVLVPLYSNVLLRLRGLGHWIS